MSDAITLNIKFFGALRKYNTEMPLLLNATSGETVSQVRHRLTAFLAKLTPDFKDHDLIKMSALAQSHTILTEDFVILASGDIFILPPVCGG